jgi:hypothetical protein
LFGRRRAAARGRTATKDDLAALRDWAAGRTGVEAFLEPQTSVTDTTLLLVAGDGEFTRRRVASASAAADFARRMSIPIYDTNRVGTPQRMRDYAQRMAAKEKVVVPPRVAKDSQAIAALAEAASLPVPQDPDDDALRDLWRAARSRVHPDRSGGDRTAWDAVEDAARKLGLSR